MDNHSPSTRRLTNILKADKRLTWRDIHGDELSDEATRVQKLIAQIENIDKMVNDWKVQRKSLEYDLKSALAAARYFDCLRVDSYELKRLQERLTPTN